MKNRSAVMPFSWLFILLLLPVATHGMDTGIDPATCRALYLYDETGKPVIGMEDMVLSPSEGQLFISAYDRRAAEREADDGAVVTQGGIYRAALSDVIAGGRLQVETVIDSQTAAGPMRPHGIDLWSGTEGALHLTVINRVYPGEEGTQNQAIIQTFLVDESHGDASLVSVLPEDALLCRPNDLAVVHEQMIIISNDHGACGGIAKLWEDVWGLSRSRLFVYRDGAYLAIGPQVAFANGVALLRGRTGRLTGLALSATRDRKVMLFDLEGSTSQLDDSPSELLDLSAAPDNITVTPDGQLYVAAHPDLFRYALYRAELFGIDRAPSLVYRIHRDSSGHWHQQVVFEDSGELISGATVALSANGHLIVGSAYDDHLLVCSMEAE